MTALTHYVFRSVWHVQAPPAAVLRVLNDLESYPAWWPEVRGVRALGGGRFAVVARSFLPYELRFVIEATTGDAEPGVIRARLSGDMEGSVRWTVDGDGDGSRLTYDQEVTTHRRLLNVAAPFARPAFKANHALMMRHGEAGLRAHLGGHASGSPPPGS